MLTHGKLRTLLITTLCISATWSPQTHAVLLSWDTTSGDWHDPGNWSPIQTPAGFDQALINNGGSASIGTGVPASVSSLGIAAGSGNTAGELISASDVSAGNTITIGSLSGGIGNSATGQMTVNNANVSGTVRVGTLTTSDLASSADGSLNIASGNLTVTNSFGIDIGRSLNTQGTANGSVVIDGTLSIVTFSPVFAPTLAVGVSGGGDATGLMTSASLDTSASALGDVGVGVASTFNSTGSAIGQVQLSGGRLDTTGDLSVGTALGQAGGFAQGEALMPDVDVRAVGGSTQQLQVGTATATGLANNLGQASATGEMNAKQVSGFDAVTVGRAIGTHLNGLEAEGALMIGSGGLQGNAAGASTLEVGVIQSAPNNNQVFGEQASATGRLDTQGGLSDFSDVRIGVNGTDATGAGLAEGSLSVAGGDVSIERNLSIGSASVRSGITHNDNGGAAVIATGTATLTGGTLSMGPSSVLAVGQAVVSDSSAVPAVNPVMATGSLTLNGVTVEAASTDLNVGFVLAGFGDALTHRASGTLEATAGQLAVRDIRVGLGSGQGAQASGLMSLDAVDLTAQNLTIGAGSGSDAAVLIRNASADVVSTLSVAAFNSLNGQAMRGALTLEQAQMTVGGSAAIGPSYQGGTGTLTLIDSSLGVAEDLFLGRSSNQQSLFGAAELWLERSTITIGQNMVFDIGASLSMLVFGTDRGTGYGAIDTGTAALDGRLLVDLSQAAVASGDTFDLIVSDGLGQITGNFLGADAIGLGSGLAARFGIVNDWVNGAQVDIYRLTVDAQRVPEPGSLALALVSLLALTRYTRAASHLLRKPRLG